MSNLFSNSSLMNLQQITISLVVPCFNEEGNIEAIYQLIKNELDTFVDFELVFVDDGSTDQTLPKIIQLSQQDSRVRYINLSRNFGHQNALKAGLDLATGDCVISLDADLQHPPRLIKEFIEKWQQGYEVVYSVRKSDPDLSIFKRLTSKLFYKFINFFSDTSIQEGAADFRLLDRKVVNVIKSLPENYLFIRGLTSWVGFHQIGIEYKPEKRFSGQTKYSLKRMIHFASSGITSFSTKPLRLSIYLGFFIAIVSFIYGLFAIYEAIFTSNVIQGWTSVIVSVLFIGGIQLIMIGILGEYLGKLFMENKRRPNYIVKETNLKDK
jgi:polyisoprenyl-phosphate glycosyltransferase